MSEKKQWSRLHILLGFHINNNNNTNTWMGPRVAHNSAYVAYLSFISLQPKPWFLPQCEVCKTKIGT